MSTLSLTNNSNNFKRLIQNFLGYKSFETSIPVITDYSIIYDALYKTDYNLMILENSWVKGVFSYIKGIEICNRLNIKKNKIIDIQKTLKEKGFCIISQRTGFFKKIEFHITGFWDY